MEFIFPQPDWYKAALEKGPTEAIAFVKDLSSRELSETISALANNRGGVILVGATRDGDVHGYDFRDIGAFVDGIAEHFREPLPSVIATDGVYENLSLPIIEVSQMREVVRLTDGSAFLRRRDANEKLGEVATGASPQSGLDVESEKVEGLAQPTGSPLQQNKRQRAHLPTVANLELPQIDLLLSGGGYRATLFHLGLLRFLYEYEDVETREQLLSKVQHIIGVSGGSITAAHFSINYSNYLANFSAEAMKLVNFVTNKDMRRDLLRRKIGIAESLSELLGEDQTFEKLSPKINVELLGTDYDSGGTVAFGTKGITHLRVNSTTTSQSTQITKRTKLTAVRVRQAAAASSAFPPVFPPLVISPELFFGGCNEHDLYGLIKRQIGDGGVRDNLGIEYYFTTCDQSSACLISDAGYPFDFDSSDYVGQSVSGWGLRMLRVVYIQMDRLQSLDCKELHGAYLLSMSTADNALLPPEDDERCVHNRPLSRAAGRGVLNIQTDFVQLTKAEAFATIRLGYDIAERQFGANSKFSSRFRKRANLPDKNFWKKLWPNDLTTTEINAEDPIVAALPKRRSRFVNPFDFIAHIPTKNLWQSLAILLIVVLVSGIVGGFIHSKCFVARSVYEDANAIPLRDEIDQFSVLSPKAKMQLVEDVTIKAYLHEDLEGQATEVATLFFLGQSNTSNGNVHPASSSLASIKIQLIRIGTVNSDSIVLHARTASSAPSSEAANDYTETHVYHLRESRGKPEHVWSSTTDRPCKVPMVKTNDVLFVVAGYPDGFLDDQNVYQDPLQIEVDDYAGGKPIRFLVGAGAMIRKPRPIRNWSVFPCETGPRVTPLLDGVSPPTGWGDQCIADIKLKLLPEIVASFSNYWRAPDGVLPQRWKKTFESLQKDGDLLPGNWYYDQQDAQLQDTLHLIEWTP